MLEFPHALQSEGKGNSTKINKGAGGGGVSFLQKEK